MEPFRIQEEEYFVIADWMKNDRQLDGGFYK